MLATTRTHVLVRATDPILRNGVCMTLRTRPEIWVADGQTDTETTVALVAADRFDDTTARLLRAVQAQGFTKIVLVAAELAESETLTAVESGVCAVARRAEATPEVLVRLVKAAAAGEGALPPDLLGGLVNRVSRLQRQVLEPRGLELAGVTARETEVRGWWRPACRRRRSRTGCATRSGRSRASCTTSRTGSSSGTGRTRWPTRSARV